MVAATALANRKNIAQTSVTLPAVVHVLDQRRAVYL
jgi:hypothetical protein